MEAQLVLDIPCHTGEAPLWHPDRQLLYWVDIPQGHLHSYSPRNREHAVEAELPVVGGLTLDRDGSLILFLENGEVGRFDEGRRFTKIRGPIDEAKGIRFNDVEACPDGSVVCGTMGRNGIPGALYRLFPDSRLEKLMSDLGTSNGLAFSPDLRTLYYSHTTERLIYRFAYDPQTHELGEPKPWFKVPDDLGRPDGVCTDAAGNIWIGMYAGGQAVQYAPEGEILLQLRVPDCKNVTSLAFGGPGNDVLYITTAGGQDRVQNGALAGSLFQFQPEIGAGPIFCSDLSRLIV